MGRFGVYRFVTRHHRITDDAVEELLDGQVPEGHEELAHLARFTADLRSFSTTSSDATLTVAAAHTSDKGDLPATAASNANGPTQPWQGAGLPNWNRRPAMLKSFLGNAIARAAVGLTAATVAVGSAGAAGALPGPVQRVVADAADVVGFNLPTPDDDATVDPATDTGTSVDDSTVTPEDGDTVEPAPAVDPNTAPTTVAPGDDSEDPAPVIDPGNVTFDPPSAVDPSDDDSADDPSDDPSDDDSADDPSDDQDDEGDQG